MRLHCEAVCGLRRGPLGLVSSPPSLMSFLSLSLTPASPPPVTLYRVRSSLKLSILENPGLRCPKLQGFRVRRNNNRQQCGRLSGEGGAAGGGVGAPIAQRRPAVR